MFKHIDTLDIYANDRQMEELCWRRYYFKHIFQLFIDVHRKEPGWVHCKNCCCACAAYFLGELPVILFLKTVSPYKRRLPFIFLDSTNVCLSSLDHQMLKSKNTD